MTLLIFKKYNHSALNSESVKVVTESCTLGHSQNNKNCFEVRGTALTFGLDAKGEVDLSLLLADEV